MLRRALFTSTVLTLSPAILSRPAAAQQPAPDATASPLPDSVRLLVGFGRGSGTDVAARALADGLRERLGRRVEVVNRLGRASATAAEAVARAAPDGGTLGIVPPTFSVSRHVVRELGFDPTSDFTPISLIAVSPVVVLAAPDLPARDLRGLGDALKVRSDAACAVLGIGTFLHLTGDLLMRGLGARCRPVPYDDPAQAMADLQAGRVLVYVNAATTALPAARAGRATALAVTSRRRVAMAPELPTVAETIPGFEAEAWWALIGPRGLPAPIVTWLERAAMEAARDPAVAARLRALGAEPVGSTAAELADRLREEDAKWGEAARAAGLAAQ